MAQKMFDGTLKHKYGGTLHDLGSASWGQITASTDPERPQGFELDFLLAMTFTFLVEGKEVFEASVGTGRSNGGHNCT